MVTMLWAAPARTARADIPGVSFSIDCDVMTPGIQSTCAVPAAAMQITVGYVISNRSGAPVDIGVASAFVYNADSSILMPMAPLGNDAVMGAPWNNSCMVNGLVADIAGGPAGTTRSVALCGDLSPHSLADGSDTAEVTQRFALTGKPGVTTLTPYDGVLADSNTVLVAQCPSSTAAPAVPAPVGPCSPATVSIFPCFGDVNADRRVNVLDLMIVAKHQWQLVPSEPLNPTYDVNHDGAVNIIDLQSVAKHQSRCTQT
jgi:hypothetical protein